MIIKDFPVATSLEDVRDHFDRVNNASVGIKRASDDDYDIYESFSSFESDLYDEYGDEIFDDKIYLIDDVKLNPDYHEQFLDELSEEINIEEATDEKLNC